MRIHIWGPRGIMFFFCDIVFLSGNSKSSCTLASQLHLIVEDAGAKLASVPVSTTSIHPATLTPHPSCCFQGYLFIISFTVWQKFAGERQSDSCEVKKPLFGSWFSTFLVGLTISIWKIRQVFYWQKFNIYMLTCIITIIIQPKSMFPIYGWELHHPHVNSAIKTNARLL